MGTLDVKNLEVENPAMASVTRRPAEKDAVDAALEVWGRELPNLDLETEGIVERIDKLERYVESAMQGTLEAHDLSHGEWKLMAHLRWGGPPYRGKPGKLAERLGLSSGAMTNRLDNLERRKLLRRVDDPDDRRAVFVELTDEGQAALGQGGRRSGGEGIPHHHGARRPRAAAAERASPPARARLRA